MYKILITMGILALAALVGENAEAKGPKGTKSGPSATSKSSQVAKNTKVGTSFKSKDGKSHPYSHIPSHLDKLCHHHDYRRWTHYCWFDRFGCNGCYCPERSCWFYWYEPFYCYMPVEYIKTYRPVEVAPAGQAVNVNVNTNTNVNGSAAPSLPAGATPVQSGFIPPGPKQ